MKCIIAILLIASLASCSKTEPTKTVTNNHTDTVTVAKSCRQMETSNYNAAGGLNQKSTYYYTTNKLDSIVTNVYQPSVYKTWVIATYNGDLERRLNYYTASGIQPYYFKEYLDANGNVVRSDNFNNNTQSGYSTATWTCN
jgi:heterodisulfide reductase subunit B